MFVYKSPQTLGPENQTPLDVDKLLLSPVK